MTDRLAALAEVQKRLYEKSDVMYWWKPACDDDVDTTCKILPELIAAARTCREIANHGCGCGRTEDDISYWCEDLHPDDKERWCWSCLARPAVAALEARLAELGVGDE